MIERCQVYVKNEGHENFLQAIKRNDKWFIFLFLRICFNRNKKLFNFEDIEIKNLNYYNSYYNIFQSVLFYIFF